MFRIVAYTKFNTTYEWEKPDINGAREYAKRIITEGLWTGPDGEGIERFYPVHQVVKVKIIPEETPK